MFSNSGSRVCCVETLPHLLFFEAHFIAFIGKYFFSLKIFRMTYADIVKKELFVIKCQHIYRYRRKMKEIFMRSRISHLPLEVWQIISHAYLNARKNIRLLCYELSKIPLRLNSNMTCYLCKREPFVPVQLRFDWNTSFGFCPKNNSVFCSLCKTNRLFCSH